jgi:hypothetical protein
MSRRLLTILALSFAAAPFQPTFAQQAAPAAPLAPQPGVQPAPGAPLQAAPGALATTNKGYLLFRLGGFMPTGGDFKDNYGLGTGVDFQVGAGMFLTPTIAGELAIGRFAASGSKSVSGVDFAGPYTADMKTDLTVLSITGGVRAFLPLDKGSLQGLLGVGIYQGEAKADFAVADLTGGAIVSGSKTSSTFGFYFGAAYAYPVTPNFDIGAEASMLLGPTFSYIDFNKSRAARDVVEGDVGLSGLRLFLGANYRF